MGGMRHLEGGVYGHMNEDSKVAASTAVCVAPWNLPICV